jgi:hypothetical protein
MINNFVVGFFLTLAITVIAALSLSDQYSTESLNVAGYEQNSEEYAENACGNGILPKNIPCTNVDNRAKGDKNIVNIEGIVFP